MINPSVIVMRIIINISLITMRDYHNCAIVTTGGFQMKPGTGLPVMRYPLRTGSVQKEET
ncbi:hypothetical protein UA45_19400 [Morganella morganii]|uniref:Uncharacterized protein n=1 Tax=Morganella morganii TaxID=582 RepID=A0A0D8L2Z6_MORMO|nr:hypothetical protein UA45_19400 [Morganella morganii]